MINQKVQILKKRIKTIEIKVRKKNIFFTIFLFLQFLFSGCSNQGAFELNSIEKYESSLSRADQLFLKISHSLEKLNESADPLAETGLLNEINQSLSELNSIQQSTEKVYVGNITFLENKFKDLGCVQEDNDDFSKLLSSTQEQCKEINREISMRLEQRNKFKTKFGDGISSISGLTEQANNLRKNGVTPTGIIGTAMNARQLMDFWERWN